MVVFRKWPYIAKKIGKPGPFGDSDRGGSAAGKCQVSPWSAQKWEGSEINK